ncbi:glutamine--tRNA ligase [Pantoea sp. Aalb]|uniref:glutamine--tRNA ligase n=1 Tax=Pantoea sp. Aalb TaxID=2576762 RepID=UPI001321EC34|nr:glutamine--tRNA ligase [Pantoea sp. Aalb]MXP67544.1 glutamine--tRNA ligase [Pantoea sp. Aalb]
MIGDESYPINFISKIIDADLASGKYKSIHTRFPPEPNGYLHIGHAKSICLNFGIAQAYQGECNMRFDDTNPIKENIEFVDSIKYDVKWLGFKWSGNIHYSSDYFDQFFNYAIELINKGLAYVDELSIEDIRNYRGTLTQPGRNSPYRDRSINENLVLFQKMREGRILEGKACLRAKINMSSNFMVLRDPVLYRIKFSKHYRTGNKWCIYPMYDFSHCISDAIEGITHSLCTLEFQDNRRLYDWILENITISSHPRQYEFSRLNLEYFVMSKRKLNMLVTDQIVTGWNDPRMFTISGLRRRGYSAASIRKFCLCIGVTKQDNLVEMASLESCIRNELNEHAPRAMAVLDPLKLIIENLPIGYEKIISMANHPQKEAMGRREVPFSREVWINRADFREKDHKQYKRLILGKKVRLRNAYVIRAERVVKDIEGNITCIYCTCDINNLYQDLIDNHTIKGVIHWVSVHHGLPAQFHLYDRLFNIRNLSSIDNLLKAVNPNSLIIKKGFVEPSLLNAIAMSPYQFEREGYFCVDSVYSQPSQLVFNRIVNLRDIWKNIFN